MAGKPEQPKLLVLIIHVFVVFTASACSILKGMMILQLEKQTRTRESNLLQDCFQDFPHTIKVAEENYPK